MATYHDSLVKMERFNRIDPQIMGGTGGGGAANSCSVKTIETLWKRLARPGAGVL
jgi:hypothetical protein